MDEVNMDSFDYGPSKPYREPWPQRIYKLRELRGNKCEVCDKPERFDKKGQSNLQFAHIKRTPVMGRGRGQMRRYMDIIAHPDCYKLVCKPCHNELGDPVN